MSKKSKDIEDLVNKYNNIIHYFQSTNPNAKFELNYSNKYQLLISLILSARCTDKLVNEITPTLFKKYKNIKELSKATYDDLYNIIEPINFSENKTNYLINLSNMIINDFNGKIPKTINELVKLPGVGTKTANMYCAIIYNLPYISVDTHVSRVSQRIGLTNHKTINAIEKDLSKYIPDEYKHNINKNLILHGRYICTFYNPKCNECKINKWCNYYKN